jgi:hypothetical protein
MPSAGFEPATPATKRPQTARPLGSYLDCNTIRVNDIGWACRKTNCDTQQQKQTRTNWSEMGSNKGTEVTVEFLRAEANGDNRNC